jgi:hypothetical protein
MANKTQNNKKEQKETKPEAEVESPWEAPVETVAPAEAKETPSKPGSKTIRIDH